MAIKLFTLKDGDIVINKIEILTIPTFRKILTRDKGSKGDADGRKKLFAFKEFAYIYHMADYKSTPNSAAYSRSKAHKYALTVTGLPDNYKPDSVVLKAIEYYKKEQFSLPRQTINNLTRAYGMVNNIVDKLTNTLQKWIDKDELTVDEAKSVLNTIELLIEQGNKLPSLTQKLNLAVRELERLEEKELRDKVKGTDEYVPNSADPNKRY